MYYVLAAINGDFRKYIAYTIADVEALQSVFDKAKIEYRISSVESTK